LKENYLIKNKEEIMKDLKSKSWDSIRKKAKKLGLIKNSKNELWSDEEINYLKKNYENTSKDDIIESLSNRTWQSIKLMGRKLNLYRNNVFF
jgi:oligoribonuclease NrnB/cAMP/cGMP phosphodiesterase (DHH superfamily)